MISLVKVELMAELAERSETQKRSNCNTNTKINKLVQNFPTASLISQPLSYPVLLLADCFMSNTPISHSNMSQGLFWAKVLLLFIL